MNICIYMYPVYPFECMFVGKCVYEHLLLFPCSRV